MVPNDSTEDLEDPWCARRTAATFFRVKGNRLGACTRHDSADRAFDQVLDRQRDGVTAQQPFYPDGVLQEDRRDRPHPLELAFRCSR